VVRNGRNAATTQCATPPTPLRFATRVHARPLRVQTQQAEKEGENVFHVFVAWREGNPSCPAMNSREWFHEEASVGIVTVVHEKRCRQQRELNKCPAWEVLQVSVWGRYAGNYVEEGRS